MVSYYGSRGDISVSKYSKDVVGVIIYDSLGWDVDRSISAEVGRCDNGRADSDVGDKVGRGDGEVV